MMHLIDAVLDSFSNLFRSHRYSPLEKPYSVFLHSRPKLNGNEGQEEDVLQQREISCCRRCIGRYVEVKWGQNKARVRRFDGSDRSPALL
jgi:hypothetical protein